MLILFASSIIFVILHAVFNGFYLPNPFTAVAASVFIAMVGHLFVGLARMKPYLTAVALAWDTLRARYVARSHAGPLDTHLDLSRHMLGTRSMDEYLGYIELLADQLLKFAPASPLSNTDLVAYALMGLPQEYESFVTSIAYGRDTITFEELRSKLMHQENQLKERGYQEDHHQTPNSEIAQAQREVIDSGVLVSEYDVFLSFRGPDSRQFLADVLYSDMTVAGVRVFRDNNEVDAGDKINKILPCIKNSKICVPIFSKTFAASAWCLREVEKMVELDKMILPIFYEVTPDDVKLRTGLFKKDLRNHEKKHGSVQVKKWEDALKAVGKIIGQEVQSTGLAEFSKSFVRALIIKLTVKKKYVTDSLVKRDDPEEDLMKLLDVRTDDVARRVIGIHGMGGVGKTTLAKVVFNRLQASYDCYSFLENIQEAATSPKGLECLQKQLLEDLDPKLKDFPVADPVKMLKEKFGKWKVLIILDDVNERKQVDMIVGALDQFGYGSRIVITTRDKRVFTEETHAFEVHDMDQDQALQLFSKRAFHKDSPPSDRRSLSDQVVSLTGRLPLALEVIGSRLYGCQENIWKETIKKLEKVPNQDVQRKLRISYDALDYEAKQIFLDIACFFVDKEMSSAMHMWEDCDLFPALGIDVLVSMSLMKITTKFWMHDLVRDLGRAIVREEYPREPAKWSRTWSRTEALEVLKIKKGKEKVEALCVEEPYNGILTNREFSSFSSLRLLKLVAAKLEGDFEDLLPQLRWFVWRECPSDFAATNLSLEKLVVLDLSESLITETWAGWILIQVAKNLQIMNLTNCRKLESMPDLSNNEALERLILRGCRSLAKIHTSIGKLKRLKHLDLGGCPSLRGFPEEFGSLSNLEEILVEGNGGTFYVPESIGNLHSLSVIKLKSLKVRRIPHSIGELVNLTHLNFSNCKGIYVLPESIGNLKSLVELNLSGTELRALPNTVGRLAKLRSLYLELTKIAELPNTIGDLKSLEVLDLRHSALRNLPDCVGELKSLLHLDLSETKVSVLPNSIGQLDKLRFLNLESTDVKELPDTLGHLTSLIVLHLMNTCVEELPDSVRGLTSLEKLELSLSSLRVLPDWLGDLKSLRELYLGSTAVSVLPDSIGQLDQLESLGVSVTDIEELPDSLGALRSLEVLNLYGTPVRVLPDWVGDLESLSELNLAETKVSVLPNSIGQLGKLEQLDLSSTEIKELPHTLGCLKSLEVLNMSDTNLKELPDSLRALNSLVMLDLAVTQLRFLPAWVGDLSELESLRLDGCKISKLPSAIAKLTKLKSLSARGCKLLTEIPTAIGIFLL